MSSIRERLRAFMDDLATDPVEERAVEYVLREVRNGRRLTEALHDPYVKNRLSEERLEHVLENPDLSAALEEQIAESFRTGEFGFPQ